MVKETCKEGKLLKRENERFGFGRKLFYLHNFTAAIKNQAIFDYDDNSILVETIHTSI